MALADPGVRLATVVDAYSALIYGMIPPGHYRVEVHNWAGAPGTEVELEIRFFNQSDQPGPPGTP